MTPRKPPKRRIRSASARCTWWLSERLVPSAWSEEVFGDLVEQAADQRDRPSPLPHDDPRLALRALAMALGLRLESAHWLIRDELRHRHLRRRQRTATMQHLAATTRSLHPLRRAATDRPTARPPPQETSMPSRPPASTERRRSALATVAELTTELRLGSRSLMRAPSLSAAVVLTLTLGIAGTTGMFGVVRSVLMRPLPLPQPEQLVRIGDRPASARQAAGLRGAEGLDGMTAVGASSAVLIQDDSAIELRGLLVDGHHHQVFGMTPAIGRALEPSDDLPGAAPVVVLAHHTWERWFGADPSVIPFCQQKSDTTTLQLTYNHAKMSKLAIWLP